MRKWGVWHMRRQQWRSALTILTVLTLMAITGGTSLAGTSEVRERVSLDLASTGANLVTGDAELRLRMRDEDVRFRARATAEGEGLVEGESFSLCVDDGFPILLIDTAEAEELVEEEESGGEPVEEEEEAVEVGVDLGGELTEVPFSTLLDLTVTIREGVGCSGEIILTGTVVTVDR